MCAGADLRLLRAAVFAAACTALAAAGHLGAGGPPLPAWTLLAAWAAVCAVCLPLAGRERPSLPALTAALAAGQLALHHLFSLGQFGLPAHGGDGSGGALALAARLLCNDYALTLTEAEAAAIAHNAGLAPAAPAADAAAQAAQAAPSGPLMLAGHLLAALAAGALLRRGDAALWQLVRLAARVAAARLPWPLAVHLARLLHGALRPTPYLPGAARADRLPAGTKPPALLLAHSMHRRGPPAAPLILAA
ncbi:hypothetical protein ACFV5N_05550 [Streptomyces sp. NPDC059853]|uniref:hypothetical protein n=1 Tax=Streptomyces sp. NPDC059853 TaxID=3346973 RepID=UPI003659A6BE